MYKKIIIILFVATIFSGGCNEDLLDKTPLDKITAGSFDVDLAIVGVYDALQLSSLTHYYPYYDALTPIGYARYTGNGFYPIQAGYHDQFHYYFATVWSQGYEGIFRANDFLEKVEGVEMDEAKKTRFIAEARFIRAFVHHRLTLVFGDIVFLDHVTGVDEGRTLTRIPKAEVISKIIQDLDFAIENLPVTQTDIGRITKGTALGLKARIYLYQNDWSNVKSVTEAIFALNEYSLLPSYNDIFLFTNENNSEVLFDVQFIGPDVGEGNSFEHLVGYKDRMRNGWFHVQPTKDLVDLYETTDGSPIDPNDEYANRDSRFYTTVLFPGATIYGSEYSTSTKTFRKGTTKFALRKFIIEDDGGIANARSFDASNNWIIIRYADILLMWAEAENELNGPSTSVYDVVNQVRLSLIHI